MKRKRLPALPMLKIGITGGIGSGKTTASRIFESLGVPVYYADERAKYLMQHEHFLIDSIKQHFGNQAYVNGQLNRTYLAGEVFKDPQKVKLLNSLVHPAVFRDTERWLLEQQDKHIPYTLKEAALLIESGASGSLDRLIVVTAPLQTRLERVMKRDHITEEAVMERMKNQLPEEEKLAKADFIIHNDTDVAHVEKQVRNIHEQLLQLHRTLTE